jgi:hypothetical protein
LATNVILDALRDEVLPGLVAEARALGVRWTDIGEALGIGDTAAQKRFGKERESKGDYDPATWETKVAQLTSDLAIKDMYRGDESLKAEFMEDLEGTTPAERMQYAFRLISGAYVSLQTGRGRPAAPSGRAELRLVYQSPRRRTQQDHDHCADAAP